MTDISNLRYLYNLKTGETIGINKGADAPDGAEVTQEKVMTDDGNEWQLLGGKTISENIKYGTVEDLSFEKIVELFLQGNMTVEELEKGLKAKGVENANIRTSGTNTIVTFNYQNKDYNLYCNTECVESQVDDNKGLDTDAYKSEYTYNEKGQKSGTDTWYDENGNITNQRTYTDGKETGCKQVAKYDNGNIRYNYEYTYPNGDKSKKAGIYTKYDANGNKVSVTKYENGHEVETINYDNKGNICLKTVYQYSDDSKLQSKITTNSDGKETLREEYDKNGVRQLHIETTYDLNGKKINYFEAKYDENGNLKSAINEQYKNGQKTYESTTEYKNGNTVYFISYKYENGQKIRTNECEYDEEGRLIHRYNGTLLQEEWHEYDANGNEIYIKEKSGSGSITETRNEYDRNNNIISTKKTTTSKGAVVSNSTKTYTYDKSGNLLSTKYHFQYDKNAYVYNGIYEVEKEEVYQNGKLVSSEEVKYGKDKENKANQEIIQRTYKDGVLEKEYIEKYDSYGELSKKQQITYDANGNETYNETTFYSVNGWVGEHFEGKASGKTSFIQDGKYKWAIIYDEETNQRYEIKYEYHSNGSYTARKYLYGDENNIIESICYSKDGKMISKTTDKEYSEYFDDGSLKFSYNKESDTYTLGIKDTDTKTNLKKLFSDANINCFFKNNNGMYSLKSGITDMDGNSITTVADLFKALYKKGGAIVKGEGNNSDYTCVSLSNTYSVSYKNDNGAIVCNVNINENGKVSGVFFPEDSNGNFKYQLWTYDSNGNLLYIVDYKYDNAKKDNITFNAYNAVIRNGNTYIIADNGDLLLVDTGKGTIGGEFKEYGKNGIEPNDSAVTSGNNSTPSVTEEGDVGETDETDNNPPLTLPQAKDPSNPTPEEKTAMENYLKQWFEQNKGNYPEGSHCSVINYDNNNFVLTIHGKSGPIESYTYSNFNQFEYKYIEESSYNDEGNKITIGHFYDVNGKEYKRMQWVNDNNGHDIPIEPEEQAPEVEEEEPEEPEEPEIQGGETSDNNENPADSSIASIYDEDGYDAYGYDRKAISEADRKGYDDIFFDINEKGEYRLKITITADGELVTSFEDLKNAIASGKEITVDGNIYDHDKGASRNNTKGFTKPNIDDEPVQTPETDKPAQTPEINEPEQAPVVDNSTQVPDEGTSETKGIEQTLVVDEPAGEEAPEVDGTKGNSVGATTDTVKNEESESLHSPLLYKKSPFRKDIKDLMIEKLKNTQKESEEKDEESDVILYSEYEIEGYEKYFEKQDNGMYVLKEDIVIGGKRITTLKQLKYALIYEDNE